MKQRNSRSNRNAAVCLHVSIASRLRRSSLPVPLSCRPSMALACSAYRNYTRSRRSLSLDAIHGPTVLRGHRHVPLRASPLTPRRPRSHASPVTPSPRPPPQPPTRHPPDALAVLRGHKLHRRLHRRPAAGPCPYLSLSLFLSLASLSPSLPPSLASIAFLPPSILPSLDCPLSFSFSRTHLHI
jgi:hypothetical protein